MSVLSLTSILVSFLQCFNAYKFWPWLIFHIVLFQLFHGLSPSSFLTASSSSISSSSPSSLQNLMLCRPAVQSWRQDPMAPRILYVTTSTTNPPARQLLNVVRCCQCGYWIPLYSSLQPSCLQSSWTPESIIRIQQLTTHTAELKAATQAITQHHTNASAMVPPISKQKEIALGTPSNS